MKYKSKPVVIEAMKLTRKYADVCVAFIGIMNIESYNLGEFKEDPCYIQIKTLEGIIKANEGDWIIRDTEGEFYPCKDVVFKKKYEPVGED